MNLSLEATLHSGRGSGQGAWGGYRIFQDSYTVKCNYSFQHVRNCIILCTAYRNKFLAVIRLLHSTKSFLQ